MASSDRDIVEETPEADRLEQERPDLDEAPDPEAPVSASRPPGAIEADDADVIEQSLEVGDDDDYPGGEVYPE